MNVQLQKTELERFVQDQVKSGQFPSAEAVIEESLIRMMEEDLSLTDEDIAAIHISDAQLDRGEGISAEDVATRMRKIYGTSRKVSQE